MKILVTGSTGFVGKNLCKTVVADGHELFAQARDRAKFQRLQIPGTFIDGDLSPSSVAQWTKQLPEDLNLVIHTAATVHSFNVRDFYDVNFRGTEALVKELSLRFNKITFILISSLSAAGPTKKGADAITEKDSVNPINNYGQSKLMAELILRDISPSSWKNIVLRPPIIIGAEDDAFFDLIEMVQNKYVIYPGKGSENNLYSFVAIEDLVDNIANIIALKTKVAFDTFFISNPQPITFDKIISEIEKNLEKKEIVPIHLPLFLLHLFAMLLFFINRLGIKIKLRITNDKVFELAQKSWICSSQKSQNEFNATYKFSVESSIKSAVDSYLNLRKKLN